MSERLQGVGPYAHDIKKLEDDIKATLKKVNEKMGPWWHGPANEVTPPRADKS